MEAELNVELGADLGRSYTLLAGREATLGSAAGSTIHVADAPPHAASLLLGSEALVVRALAAGCTLDGRPLPSRAVPVVTGTALGVGSTRLRVTLIGDDGRPLEPPSERAVDAGLAEIAACGFVVQRPLGEGATGRVFAALGPDGRLVAVKLLREAIVPGSPEHERFLREAAVGARLRDPSIAEVLGLYVRPRATFLVIEFVAGRSAEALVREVGPLALPAALKIAEGVARALAVAAAQGVVHRDVKPANVLVAPDGSAKLTDFGAAKDLDATVRALTLSGQGLGTLAYLPPEQITQAKHVDPRADLYALGATLYHLLAGRPPFALDDVQGLFAAVEALPPSLSTLRPGLPPEVVSLVEALLAKDPFQRPPSARRVGRALRRMRQG